MILDPKGSGKMVRVYQCGGLGRLSATVRVEVNRKEKLGLLDTGSQITLIGQKEAEKLALDVTPNEEDIHGVTVSGEIFPLIGEAVAETRKKMI